MKKHAESRIVLPAVATSLGVVTVLLAGCPRPPPSDPCDLIECPPGEVEVPVGDRCECEPAADGDADVDADADGDEDIGCEADGLCNDTCEWDVDCVEGCPPEGLPYGGECDPIAETCCPPEQRCLAGQRPLEYVVTEYCSDVVGDGSQGDPCYDFREADCGPGTTCFGLGFVDQCQDFCETTEDCPDDGEEYDCVPIASGATEYGVCIPGPSECSPLDGSGCREGQTCVLLMRGRDGATYPICVAEGEHSEGEHCGDGRGCQPGLGCYSHPTTRTLSCFEFCDLAAPDCSSGPCHNQRHSEYGICFG